MITQSNKALVKFRSGSGGTAKGFLVSFETNCGYSVTTNGTGVIRFQDSGEPKNCTWRIHSNDPNGKIQFSVNHFSGNTTQYQDVIKFDNGVITDNIRSVSHTIYTLGNSLVVTAMVNGPTSFDATYSVYDSCT